jgi:hypothetical protein
MLSVKQQELLRQRQIVGAAGYTIQHSPPLSWLPAGWYALLPGETEFKDNSDAVEADPSIAHEQNYLGFFSSEEDLLAEVVPLANDRLKRHVHLYAVARIKVCGVDGDDQEAIASAVRRADPDGLLRQHMISYDAQRTARDKVAHVEFADEFTRFLVDLIGPDGEMIEGTEAYFEGDPESVDILPGGLSTEERAAHLLGKVVQGYAKGEDIRALVKEAAEILDGRIPQETLKALDMAPARPVPGGRPRG